MITKVAFATLILAVSNCHAKQNRDGKFLSFFNVVSFPNDPCDAGTKNGTCYTKEECSNKGGTNDGSCASGYGVCCTFALNCGSTSTENNTYFESRGSESGSCRLKICPCNDNICQLRLDFESFAITGPSTLTDTVAKAIFGIVNPDSTGKEVTNYGRCLTDTFSVTSSGGNSPPAICGTNTGKHMYVDVSGSQCNDLNMLLGASGVGNSITTRSWSIRITQYSCNYANLAPEGCTEYFFGSDTGTITNYNNGGGTHLNDQFQKSCIRREKGNCRICYTTVTGYSDFGISGKGTNKFFTKSCCGYGATGKKSSFRDCLIIPGLSTTKGQLQLFSDVCGAAGLNTKSETIKSTATKPAFTLCTKRTPFMVTFDTDSYEFSAELNDATAPYIPANSGTTGFKLVYTQSSSNC